MNELLDAINGLIEHEEFDMALARLSGVELHTNPYLLLRAAACEQLAEHGSLERAKAHLKELVTRYPDFVAGLTSLGYFQFAVEDDAHSALSTFESAITLARKDEKEAAIGKAECLLEMGDKHGAIVAIRQLRLPLYEEREIFAKLEINEP